MKNILNYLLSCTLILVYCFSQAQHNRKIDSLENLLNSAKEDTLKLKIVSKLSGQYLNIGSYEQAIRYADQTYKYAEKLNDKRGIAKANNSMGNIYYYLGNYKKALENYFKSLKIYEEIGDMKEIANSNNNIGGMYMSQGNYEKALDNYLQCLKVRENMGDKEGIANSIYNIGSIYWYLGNYQKALENNLKALKIQEEIGDKIGMASTLGSLGSIYGAQENYEKALEYFLKSLKINEEIGDKFLIASSYNNIGVYYEKQKDYKKALEYHFKSLKISQEIGEKSGIASSYNNIGSIYMFQSIYNEAYHYLNGALNLYIEMGDKDGIADTYSFLSDLYDKKGDYKQAFNYHKLYSNIKDTLLNEQSSKQITEMNTKYDSEKKDKEIIKKDAEIGLQQAETEKQNLQRNAFIIGFALVLVLAFFIYRGYRQKRAANGWLEEKNILIENQKQLVEEKNRNITDSINYAKRIQQAILPSQELIKFFLPESFIFFKPKDIVSGDFYWFSEKQDKLLIAVADCTGHGVPGAFMSMIGNTLLNEIINVKNIVEPAQILNQLNNGIVSLLHQGETSATQDDGMDITILSIDKTNNEIEFAGANHFSYLIKQNQSETLTGDIFSIGGMFGRSDINFTSQKIKVEKGNSIYLFTDGFVDQFGGEKNTKFLSSRFEALLKSIQDYNLEEQHEKLNVSFDDWKGNNKQLDDVLVVGIKI